MASELNRTFDKNETEWAKTLVISKNRARPNLPEAMLNGDEVASSNNHHRERHHVRRGTVTVNENPIGSEIAQLLNEVVDEKTEDEDLLVAVQRKMANFMKDKENTWREAVEKKQRMMIGVYETKLREQQTNHAAKLPPMGPGRSLSPDQPIEQIIQERDQYREQATAAVKTLSDLIKQHERFMEKEKQYQEMVKTFRTEQKEAADAIAQAHERYHALREEAQSKLTEANAEVERVIKQHDEDTIALRIKAQKQELMMKSLETQVETLKAERKELLDMCDDLIARSERANTHNTVPGDY